MGSDSCLVLKVDRGPQREHLEDGKETRGPIAKILAMPIPIASSQCRLVHKEAFALAAADVPQPAEFEDLLSELKGARRQLVIG